MQTPPARVPAWLVTGAAGAGKSRFIRALAAARPPVERWAVLHNDSDVLGLSADNASLVRAAVSGCACCTGQVMLQTAIVRLLRKARPARLLIEVSAAAEPAALERTLRDAALARAVDVQLRLCIVATAWSAYPPPARALLLAQMHAADHVVVHDAFADCHATLTRAGVAGAKIIQSDEAIRLALASPAPGSSASSRRIFS